MLGLIFIVVERGVGCSSFISDRRRGKSESVGALSSSKSSSGRSPAEAGENRLNKILDPDIEARIQFPHEGSQSMRERG